MPDIDVDPDVVDAMIADIEAELAKKNALVWSIMSDKTKETFEDGAKYVKPKTVNEYAQDYINERGMEFVTEMTNTDKDNLKNIFLENWGSPKKIGQAVEDSYIVSKDRLEGIYQNEMHMARLTGQLLQAQDNEMDVRDWVPIGDERSCEVCLALAEENQGVPLDEPYTNGEMVAQGHIGCRCKDKFRKITEVEKEAIVKALVEKFGTTIGAYRAWDTRGRGRHEEEEDDSAKRMSIIKPFVNDKLAISTTIKELPKSQVTAIYNQLSSAGVQYDKVDGESKQTAIHRAMTDRVYNALKESHKSGADVAGLDWYKKVGAICNDCAEEFHTSPQQYAAAVAVLSANNTWSKKTKTKGEVFSNIEIASAVAEMHDENPVMEVNQADVDRWKKGQVWPTGIKPGDLDQYVGKKAHISEFPSEVVALAMRDAIQINPDFANAKIGLKSWATVAKAESIFRAQTQEDLNKVVGGLKIRSFYNNMMGYEDSPTIDRHMVRFMAGNNEINTGHAKDFPRATQKADPKGHWKKDIGSYPAFADAIRSATERANEDNLFGRPVTPSDVQAIVWYKQIESAPVVHRVPRPVKEKKPKTVKPTAIKSHVLTDDEIGKIATAFKSLPEDEQNSGAMGNKNSDFRLSKIAELQGFDAKPKLVSDKALESYAKENNMPIMYRGVSDPKYVEAFKSETYWAGKGITGNGTYAAFGPGGKGTALAYIPSEVDGVNYEKSCLMKMVLDKDAKIINYFEVLPKIAKIRDKYKSSKIDYDMFNDEGRAAAIMGYDAIRLDPDEEFLQDHPENEWSNMIILNRSKVRVVK